MREQRGSFTGIGGTSIFRRAWLPEDPPRAVVVISHGINEHSGRYVHVASRLVDAGYAVHILDHHGHGRSGGRRASIDRFQTFADDLGLFITMVAGEHPGLPLHLYGHSLGGLIAMLFLLDHPDAAAGLIVSAPGVDIPPTVTPLQIRLGRVLAKIAPNVGVASLDLDRVSRDPEVVAAYKADPLIYRGKLRARLGSGALDAVMRVRARIGELRVPLLVLQGTDDHIVPPTVGPWVAENAGAADRTLRVYEGLYHEVHNEPEKETVLDDVVAWLDAHCPPAEKLPGVPPARGRRGKTA